MELNRAVAENIKRIRKSKKLSLERTAALSGVSRSMLSQIERGEANPSVAILGKLSEALKVPAETLLENLLASDLRGIRSHGVTRLGGYMDRIERGVTSPTAQPSITTDHGPVFSVDGNSGMGSTIGMAVMAECIRRARQSGGQLPQSTTPPTTALAGFTQ